MSKSKGGKWKSGAEMGEKTDKDIQRLKNIVGKVAEDSKIRLDQMIQDFIAHPDLKEITFPNQLTNMERAYVHFQASKHGFKSFSTGSGSERRLTLRRATEKTSLETKSVTLTSKSLEGISSLERAFPPPSSSLSEGSGSVRGRFSGGNSTCSKLSSGPFPKVPRFRRTTGFVASQTRLPIWHHKDEILREIERNRVIFIRGSTGCGKTTKVSQYILDEAAQNSTKVRIICTVPRRIAAVSVSDRVAQERGERLGQTVGYQIRLESCVSPLETLLTYCTSGILLRSLSNPEYFVLKNTTHIIIDEIHERDRQTDFLLAILRDIQPMFPNLKLILMGADLNNEIFSTYFGGQAQCPIIEVEGRLHPVQVYFLEDALDEIKYENHDMRTTKHHEEKNGVYNRLVEKLAERSSSMLEDGKGKGAGGDLGKENLDNAMKADLDTLIQTVWTSGDEDFLEEFLGLVNDKVVPVNYQHCSTGVTMLMAVAVRGLMVHVQTLLGLGADVNIKSTTGDCEFSAIEWATDHHQHEVLKFLLEHQYSTKLMPAMNERSKDNEKGQRLASYLRSIDEERVDLLLLLRLLYQIHATSKPSDAILIFLPGYDEIVTLKHLIVTDRQLGFHHDSFVIFLLHSNIQTGDQRLAFEKPKKGVRKIVLSTNIAESSLTIEDIVFVIDSGKAKEKSFDSITGVSQLKSVWISKASVNQRRGRAGRCREGVCYHLFSSARYESMAEFPIPEIHRTSLQELCLHARSFMKSEVKIERFFARLPEPPAPIAVKKSVEMLKVMGVFTENEDLTSLGHRLLDFPLEPFLGKALIFAVVFQWLDPILTLVSVISYRDPFQLPSDPRDKQKAQERKAYFSQGSFSDHMAYLKAFQDWEKAMMFSDATERKFCRDNYLSSMTFEMVYAIRSQLLGQLRASGFVNTKGDCDLKQLNKNSDNWSLVKGVLVATLYPNICGINGEKKVLYNSFNSKISFHPSTTVTKKKNEVPNIKVDWIIFDEMTQQGPTNLVKGCTCVSTAAIALFAGSFTDTELCEEDNEGDMSAYENGMNLLLPACKLKINQWITLHGDKETIDKVLFLRQMIHDMVIRRLNSPATRYSAQDESTVKTIAALLASEDKAVGFKNIVGIGQWPKLVSGNLMSAPRAGFGVNLPVSEAGQTSSTRFYVFEVEGFSHAGDILRSGVWLVPDSLKEKFDAGITPNATEDDCYIVVFFWLPASQHFTGVVRLRCAPQMSFLQEVPFEIVSPRVSSLESVLHQLESGTSSQMFMNGMELECDLAGELLKIL